MKVYFRENGVQTTYSKAFFKMNGVWTQLSKWYAHVDGTWQGPADDGPLYPRTNLHPSTTLYPRGKKT